MTPEEIAADRGLLEAVKEAIAYCESNPPEVEEDYRREEALAEAIGENDPNYKYHPVRKSSHLRNCIGFFADEALVRRPESRREIHGPP